MLELNQLFEDLAEQVLVQDTAVTAAQDQTQHVVEDTENANVQLTKGVAHARRARKLKWWCFFIVLIIIAILALVLGLVFGLKN
jgi:syntaxin 1B/2/3